MACMKDALLDVLEQSIDDEGLDTIQPSAEALTAALDFSGDYGDSFGLSPLQLRRFAVGIGRFQELGG
ncbi:MAG TPA: hypothetical protein VJU18_00685 [Vicinamibacteria bacterium]|nr:hypothetical protein [Vicinamibacteria bacterium]